MARDVGLGVTVPLGWSCGLHLEQGGWGVAVVGDVALREVVSGHSRVGWAQAWGDLRGFLQPEWLYYSVPGGDAPAVSTRCQG